MKKHLIAAAVAAAVAVPAMAQVTVSGNVEVGYASAKKGVSEAAAFQQSGITSGVVGTPVIRFSGSEDLGGGLKASFQLDFENVSNTGLVDNAAADLGVSTVGLSGSFGSIVMGKAATRARDGGGLYRFFGSQGRLAAATGGLHFTSADELNSFVEYVSPTIQGFSVSVAGHGEGRTDATSQAAAGSAYTLRGAVGPVTFQYGSERQAIARTSAVTAATAATGTISWNTLAANANLGVARVGLVYVERSTDGATAKAKAMGLQAAVPLGAYTVGGSYIDYRGTATGSNTKVTAVNAVYALSKRTAVHGTYQMVTAGTTAAGIVASRGLSVGEIAGKTVGGFAVTVVHSF